MILVQLPQDIGYIPIRHKLVDVVRTVENGVYEITFAFHLGQHIVERVGKVQPALGCSIVKGNIVTTSEQLVITLFWLTVGIQAVIPRNEIFKISDGTGGVL